MFRKILAAAIAAAVACVNVQAAPSDANIAGHVIDAETGEHMPYYVIQIKDTRIATLTDGSGHYVLRDLQPGTYVIEASCTGYKTQAKTVSVASG